VIVTEAKDGGRYSYGWVCRGRKKVEEEEEEMGEEKSSADRPFFKWV
jgi:hypothetical protein